MSESQAWETMPAAEVLRELSVDGARGLSEDEVIRRRERWGANLLAEAPPVPMWQRLLNQFKELVIWILIFAAVISGVMGEWADTAAILAIVLVNGVIGFLQEEKAGRALAALQKMSSPMAKVLRDGTLQSVPAAELVPGDRIELEAGDNVPADSRLLTAFALRVQEAALTGESVPVDKDADVAFPRERRSATAGTCSIWGRSLPPARRVRWSRRPGCRRNWGTLRGCCSGRNASRLRSSGGWLSWAKCWSSSAW